MGVDGGVAGGAGEVLVLSVGDVLVCASVTVFLGQAKVDDVDQVALLAEPHQEVIGLHVSVDEVLGVDVFNPADLEQRDGGQESAEMNKTMQIMKVHFFRLRSSRNHPSCFTSLCYSQFKVT